MGQFYSKGLCPQCHKPTLTVWPLLPGQDKQRKTCGNPECHYKEG
mgnify:CR=1 FL=1